MAASHLEKKKRKRRNEWVKDCVLRIEKKQHTQQRQEIHIWHSTFQYRRWCHQQYR
ncbi:MAG: hypothetical protein Q8P67_13065 [archaeon]|nr:hypothetical protein [archaeon]